MHANKPTDTDWTARVECIQVALPLLSEARDWLRAAGTPKALEAVQRAINSAEGAQRHARLRRDTAAHRG